jgi:hypothetical protein
MDACEDAVRLAHPVQRRVAEHRIELVVERERLTVPDPRIDPARAGGCDEGRTAVDPDDATAGGSELGRQDAVATTQIEDPLAGPWVQEVDDRGA